MPAYFLFSFTRYFWRCQHAVHKWLLPFSNMIGLARTVYIHRLWPYVWWFPCQNYRIYTVYIWSWPTQNMSVFQACSCFVVPKNSNCTAMVGHRALPTVIEIQGYRQVANHWNSHNKRFVHIFKAVLVDAHTCAAIDAVATAAAHTHTHTHTHTCRQIASGKRIAPNQFYTPASILQPH